MEQKEGKIRGEGKETLALLITDDYWPVPKEGRESRKKRKALEKREEGEGLVPRVSSPAKG